MNRRGARSKWIAPQDLYFLAIVALITLLRSVRLHRLNEAAARAAGLVAYHFSLGKRRRAEANLARRLDDGLAVAERQRIVRRVFYETWREFFAWADADVVDESASGIDMHGVEHLERALEAGHGAILWESNGFGQRKVMKRVLRARGVDLHQVHGPHDLGGFLMRDPDSWWARRILRPYFDRCEKQFVKDNVYISDSNSIAFARTLISRLRGTSAVCVSGDGQLGRHRVSCAFLSGSFSFATGGVSLARLSSAPLLPVFCFEVDGRTRVIIEAPLSASRGISREVVFESALGRYARLLESYVRRYPDQYQNWHLLDDAAETDPVRPSGPAVSANR